MRLIDADKLPIWSFPISWEEGVGIEKCCKAVEEAPWIKKYMNEQFIDTSYNWNDLYDDWGVAVLEGLIEDWRKENEGDRR